MHGTTNIKKKNFFF